MKAKDNCIECIDFDWMMKSIDDSIVHVAIAYCCHNEELFTCPPHEMKCKHFRLTRHHPDILSRLVFPPKFMDKEKKK